MTLILKLWCLGVCLALSESVKNELSCYQCNVSDNIACTDEYLQPCPNKQVYDRCETRVRKTVDGRQWVEKGCALSPCNLSPEEEASLGMQCDYSAPAYDCVYCCKESGCNGGGAAAATLPLPLMILSLLTPLVMPLVVLLNP
ncbi:uncharacterized protein LOC121874236 isoform X1 [Homarus americanus]|uniref:uncharacterized protein LOC121874236 isoform X1 n=1 Tax=Homarus americanus TaxID=6706 RepID=UPI001C44E19D|nr:uncharacterized protein LOC121874236 isoform X1 [Homarus americanus]